MRWNRITLLIATLLTLPLALLAQVGGYGTYKFLNLPVSSRTAALGGNLISVKDYDVSLAVQNPSLLNKEMSNHLSLSYIDYMAGINFGSAAYARQLDSNGTGMLAMQYINYGDFVRADALGNTYGHFTAGEYSLSGAYAKEWGRFSAGSQLKLVYSSLADYNSFGAAIDLSGTYYDSTHGFTAAVVFKNMGYQLKGYEDIHEALPFEIQTGISIKPRHMPLRVSIIAHDLQRWNFRYIDNASPRQIDISTGEEIVPKVPFSEEIARHFIFGGELVFSKYFNIRFGYNHQRRKELSIADARGFVGYSYGFGFRIKKISINYGRASFSLAGASNTFTLQANLSEVFHRK